MSGSLNGGSPTTYAGSVTWAAHGALKQMTQGGLTETTSFNSRLQPTQIQAGSLLTLNYDYGTTNDNGNVLSQTITRGSQVWTQTFNQYGSSGAAYDGANRLIGASEAGPGSTSWSQTYGYDAAGNRAVTASSFPENLSVPTATSQYSSSTNHIVTQSDGTTAMPSDAYDASGNLQDQPWLGQFTYDAENRIATATVGATTTTYAYDGEGRRVEKSVGSANTVYLYDGTGDLAMEFPATALTASSTLFLTADTLGTTRLITGGAAPECHDYYPFGEEIGSGVDGRGTCYGSDSAPEKKFTGKERDTGTGLDYFGARYLSSAQGRFASPDPVDGTLVHVIDPQRWNMYAYVRNNPLAFTDPDGRDAIAVGFKTLAVHAGHAALISVHRDGSATFGSYGPKGGGKPVWAGQYVVQDLKTKVKFGSDGAPLVGSLSVLASEVADLEGVDPSTVDMAYFMTSDADTQIMDKYLADLKKRSGGLYFVGFHDCIEVCNAGMAKIGIGRGTEAFDIPRTMIWFYSAWANFTYSGETGEEKKRKGNKPDVQSTFTPCTDTSSDPACH